MAVHLRISQADEWADKGHISREGGMFRAIRSLEREIIPQVDGLVYVSQWAREALTGWLPRAGSVPSAVIDNFVAPPEAKPRWESIGDLVTVGNLEPVKNHRYLLEILAGAKRAGRVYTLDIFGEGPLRKDLHRLIGTLGLERQVRLRGFRTDLRDFLPGYYAYVHASYSESSSLAIIEAMAAGLPIVSGDIGPLSELFEDGVEVVSGHSTTLPAPRMCSSISWTTRRSARGPPRPRSLGSGANDADVIAPRLVSFVMGADPATPSGHSARGLRPQPRN